MRELKTYISEGFFNNVGANNRIKLAIDTIKDASLNDKIDSDAKYLKFRDLLAPILKDIEGDIKKGKFAFEYVRNDRARGNHKITISLEIIESNTNEVKWIYSDKNGSYKNYADSIASNIANDLCYETTLPVKEPRLRHSIANTIKVTEFKLS